MSAAETAEAAKHAGNAAFKAGNFDEAVEQFTKAIEADSTNHVLYSNRSGAHAAKGSFTEALLDANKCIELKGDWAKGHSRRGAAYFGLKNWPQAQAAYEKGLELDPSSEVMKEELEKVKLRRNPAARQAQAQAFAAAGVPAPATSPAAKMLSLGALVGGLLYTIPLLGAGRALMAYRMSLAFILALFVSNLWTRFPKKMETLSNPVFKATQEVQAFVLCIFMLMSPPMPFALMPFLTGALHNAIHGFAPQIAVLPDFLKSRLQYMQTQEGAFQIAAFGAVSEVIVTFMGPLLAVVQGYRAMLLTFFYFQYVCRRYKTNPQTVQTVGLFVEKLEGVCKHRLVPAPVQNVYSRLKYFVGLAASKIN